MSKIILIDSNSLVHRAYHALPNLKSSKGMYTGAIYGFMTLFLRLIKEQKPDYVAAAFDLKGPTFRHEMFPEYKGKRKPMDMELVQQIEPLKELLTLMGINVVTCKGYEADDILGTLSKRFNEPTIILTGDRDSFQLVSPSTSVFWTKKGVTDIEVITPESLAADGFTVQSFIDYKALRGDPSDNIPGIAGVGEKTAKQLLDTYGTLEGVLDHAAEIKGKVGETVAVSRDIALLSRTLATIDCDAPVECSLEDIKFTPVFSQEVKAKLAEYELNSLLNRMTFEGGEDEIKPAKDFEKKVVELNDIASVKKAIDGDRIAVLFGNKLSFSADGKTEYVINCGEDLFAAVTFDDAIETMEECLQNRTLICYDYKSVRRTYGIECNFFDVMIATHLARESAPIKSIETVLGGEGLEIGAAELYFYAGELEKTLAKKELDKLFFEVEQPLAVVLGNMENRGFSVDVEQLKKLQVKYTAMLDKLSEEIYEAAGCRFNIASPKQLSELLFEKMGLKHGKKSKTGGYSVSEDILDSLKDEYPIVGLILEWRRYSKLLSTYVVGLQPLVNRGKIHTEFNQCITQTGRLSSTNPNLQNIPVRSEDSKDIKSAFVPSKGNVLVSADYSQIELRLLAHFSGDEKLIAAYNRADDIHAMTASQILGKPMSEVTPSERRDAKAVNFGIIYGMSDFGLAENISVPKYVAREFIEKYFENYPTVKDYLDRNVSEAKERGYALTYLGRRRDLRDLNASNYLVRTGAERMAKNTPLQGSAADIVKLAMLGVEKRLENMKSKMILQVHDELIVDAAAEEKEAVENILREEMESAVRLRVPLIVGVSSAGNWGDMK